MKKAIFLDRDGVINELIFFAEHGIVDSPLVSSQVKLVYGVDELITGVARLGFIIIVCSNQPAVGLGKITLRNLNSITEKISSLLKGKSAVIDKFYYCMHHPFAKLKKFKVECDCRKPKTGLFLKAAKEFDIDLSKSWVIGDGVDDIKAGKQLGCNTILLANIKSAENLRIIEQQLGSVKPDFMIKKLSQAIKIIKNK